VALGVLALAGTVPLIFLRPVAAAVAITAASVLVVVAFGTPTVAGLIAQVIASYRLGWTAGFGRAAPAGDAGGVGHASEAATSGGAQLVIAALAAPVLVLALAFHGGATAVLLASAAPIAVGAAIAWRARAEEARQSAARTMLADTLTEHLARGERARIARELHDVVAHHISMIAVQAETARLTTPGLPAAGAQRFAEIGDTARSGLTEMRRLLGVLREDVGDTVGDRHPQPGLAQLAELIDSAREASGATARLIVSGPVRPFDPGVELAAYRIVQEALTNARRHAPGTAVDVELRYSGSALRLRVRDNGPGPASASAEGPGHGLLGMRERAATVGGSLQTGTAAGGAEAVRVCRSARPDVVLMDVRMPGTDGIEATRKLALDAEHAPRVLILTTFDLDEYVFDAPRAGASGFLLKDVTAERLFEGVRVVASGDSLLAPGITRRLISEFARIRPHPAGARGWYWGRRCRVGGAAHAHPARDRGPAAGRRGPVQRGDRGPAGGDRGHGQGPRQPIARQARPPRPHPGGGHRVRIGSHLSRPGRDERQAVSATRPR
jgi:signal transduction histidine kinase